MKPLDARPIVAAAAASGVKVSTIRFYEELGLLPPPPRTGGNRRLYGAAEIRRLAFIRHARDLGFPLEDVRRLLALWRDRGRASVEVKQLALAHVAALETKADSLRSMAASLRHLADHCHGDDRPDCPILEDLARKE